MPADRPPVEAVRAQVGDLPAVEGLRGAAVLLVIAFHYLVLRVGRADPFVAWADASRPVEVVLRNGYLGVELFFLISGFLLVLPWALAAMHGRPAPRVRDFYVRRIRRIVPAYYVQLALLFVLFLPLLTSLEFIRDNRGLVAYNAAAHALFLHYTTPLSSASLGINGALWTLALEAQFYLLLPLLAPRFVRSPLAWLVALTGIAFAWRWLAADSLDRLVAACLATGARWQVPEAAVRHLLATQLPGYLGHFAAGMALGLAWLRLRGRLPASAAALLLALPIAALYWLYGLAGGAVVGPYGSWLLTLAMLSTAFLALVASVPVGRLAAIAPLRFAGRVSYSAYLYHLPLLLAWNHFGLLEGSWLAAPAYLALAGAAAWLSSELVERPFLRSRERPGVAEAAPIIAR